MTDKPTQHRNLADVSYLIIDRIIYLARLSDSADTKGRIEEIMWIDRKVKEFCEENSRNVF